MRKLIFTVLLLVAAVSLTNAQDVSAIALYPDGVPNSKPTPATYQEDDSRGSARKVSVPTLIPFIADQATATGTAVIICPGGGYSGLAIESEGFAVAKAFNEIGVTAFVLKYRLPSDLIMVDKTIGPLQDAQAAIQLVRKRAAGWKINPAKIGIVGFSAGGHLASTAETHFNKSVIANPDNTSLRPDFAILMYPVVTFTELTHKGSRNNLIGTAPTPEMIDLYSNEKQVTADTPPTFIVMAQDDNVVPVENSLLFYNAMLKAKVKGELHIYQAGGHGFGLNNRKSKEKWFDWCKNWMNANGF